MHKLRFASHYKHIVLIILTSLLFLSLFPNSHGEWGDSEEDCANYHGITRHYARYVPNASIILDGVDNESAWNRPDVYEYSIPMVSNNMTELYFKTYMDVKWVYDDDYLYIRARWYDDSIEVPSYEYMNDMAMFCWNINCSNFTVGMFLEDNAMRTNENNTRADSWVWVRSTIADNESSIKSLIDQCYDDTDWFDRELDNNDPQAIMRYGTWYRGESTYQLEIRRTLTTAEPEYDVQFDSINVNTSESIYRFATGIGDGIGGEDHAISWTYELDMTNSTAPPEPPESTEDTTETSSTQTTITTTSTTGSENKISGFLPVYLFSTTVIVFWILVNSQIKQNKKLSN